MTEWEEGRDGFGGMKRVLLQLLAVSVFLVGWARGETHVFVSADGSKKLEATLLGYDAGAGIVEIRVKGGAAMKAPLSAFSKEDADYVAAAQQRLEVGRRMAVNVSGDEGEPVETKTAAARTKKLASGFKVNFRNNGTVPMEGVTAKYRIFYYEDLVKGGKADKFKDGELALSALKPQESVDLETEKVDLVTVRAQPACAT